jgi:integrase
MSVKRLAPGKYLVDITWREGGRRCRLRRQVYGSLKAARKWEQNLKNAARIGELLTEEQERSTFVEFTNDWMRTYVKANNRPGEQANKESYLRIHLVPFFGNLLLDTITSRDIERYKALKVSRAYAPQTVNLHLGCLHCLFQCAVTWGLLLQNPATGVKKLKTRKDSWDFLTFEEADQFMKGVPEHWQPLFLCALRTGMRKGEILALRWQDVDFQRRVFKVGNSLYEGELYPTKSYSSREIRISSDLLKALLPLRNNNSLFVFPAGGGGPLHPKTINRPLRTAIKQSGMKRIRFHDLRHTFASHMVMAGVPIKMVQELLGHSDLSMTLRYTHLTPESRHEAMECLERKIEGERGRKCVKNVTLRE